LGTGSPSHRCTVATQEIVAIVLTFSKSRKGNPPGFKFSKSYCRAVPYFLTRTTPPRLLYRNQHRSHEHSCPATSRWPKGGAAHLPPGVARFVDVRLCGPAGVQLHILSIVPAADVTPRKVSWAARVSWGAGQLALSKILQAAHIHTSWRTRAPP